MSGIRDIHVVDMDTLELSNLNRQILFRDEDVGKFKAEVAAARINARLGKSLGVHVTNYNQKIQDFPLSFFRQFNSVIAGLDNIEARRFLNGALCQLIQANRNAETGNLEVDPSSVIPLVDGGTEGFFGHCRLIIPGSSSCFECSLDAFPPQENFALCTLVDQPRLAEHCIEYALVVLWGKHKADCPLDTDNPDHVNWLYEQAVERARTFNISGVTLQLTIGVVKKIVPAIASTNQLIASLCVNETLKILMGKYPITSTYIMYNGSQGCTFNSLNFARKPDCPVCSIHSLFGTEITVNRKTTLESLVKQILPEKLKVEQPSIFIGMRSLYMNLPQFNNPERLSKTIEMLQSEGLMSQDAEQLLSVEAKEMETTRRVRLKLID
eukprot:Gregarina_sp_Poly_1__905@NODE_1217_length_4752_cov_23_215795_g680_i3_p2_GENE_NODE_1217_length_4752_cov_23_215795_g680_i3NODE_1217_length_4752_cov_23_215795_g680_i3_p2_ORF_typecomplete_len382_score36_33ThiF/PF00899_21/3_4e45UAE_UbL/PF14732_6/0_00022E2_bind/PF08825_10/0_00023_NODE_1217_length_4752_cov_23_215795_g680_i32091354